MKLKLMAATAFLVSSSYASAAVLILDSGWQDDTLNAAGQPTGNSPWTFNIASTATLSITDCCAPGDTFTLSGDVVGITSFYAGAADIRSTGFYGSFWLGPNFGKFSTVLGPGSYSFSITGDGIAGLPAGLGVRLDSGDLNSAVPEPATWAMMLLGFGFVGGAMRSAKRRQRLTVSYA